MDVAKRRGELSQDPFRDLITHKRVPQFRIDDIEQPWVFDTPLDFVHSRLCSGNAIRSWPNYFAEAYRSLKPGGWVEAQEFNLAVRSDDNTLPPDSKICESCPPRTHLIDKLCCV